MRSTFGLALVFAALLAGAADAHDVKVGDLLLQNPWARATPAGAPAGGAYMTIENRGTVADRLVSGTAEIAQKVEIHEMAVVDGIMKMRALDKGLEIGAGAKTELKPGGYHVMLVGLKRPLKEGETIKATLVFEKAGAVEVEYQVEAIGASKSGAHDHAAQ